MEATMPGSAEPHAPIADPRDSDSSASPATVSRPELLIDGDDTAFRDLLHDFFAFASQMEKARTIFGKHVRLSATQYMILIAISRMETAGELGINQLAEHLHLSGAFVTIEVNKLVKAGNVAKSPHPTDGRRIALRMTARGNELLGHLAELQRPVNDALFGSVNAEQFSQLRMILRLLAEDAPKALRLAEYLK